jgi:hypothetical protein
MTEENSGHQGEIDGDQLGRGPKRRRGDGRRASPIEDYLRLEYPTESRGWALRAPWRTPSFRSRLMGRWRRRRGRPPTAVD